jgi:hypothetical protein
VRQGRCGECQAGPLEDALLPIQWLMIHVFGNQYFGQQASSGNALVDDVGRHRRLHQGLALPADPFASPMPFDRKDAGLAVELLGDLFADAL